VEYVNDVSTWEKRKRGLPHRIWRDEVEDDLNVMEIKTDRQ
jgi:hypothetical protein